MSVEAIESSDGQNIAINVRGRFDFSQVNAFRKAYEAHPKTAHYTIDLKQTEHIDSSALGMLLNMRNYLGGDKARIEIVNAAPGIMKIFEISRFDKKFTIR